MFTVWHEQIFELVIERGAKSIKISQKLVELGFFVFRASIKCFRNLTIGDLWFESHNASSDFKTPGVFLDNVLNVVGIFVIGK